MQDQSSDYKQSDETTTVLPEVAREGLTKSTSPRPPPTDASAASLSSPSVSGSEREMHVARSAPVSRQGSSPTVETPTSTRAGFGASSFPRNETFITTAREWPGNAGAELYLPPQLSLWKSSLAPSASLIYVKVGNRLRKIKAASKADMPTRV